MATSCSPAAAPRALSLIVAVSLGCQSIVTIDAKDDASAPTPPPMTPWGCLDNSTALRQERDQPIVVRRRYLAFNPNDRCEDARAVPGAVVNVCNGFDHPCASPVETVTTDCDGYVTLTRLYKGFVGFLEVTPPRPEGAHWGEVATCFEKLAAASGGTDPCLSGVPEKRFPLPRDMMPLLDMLVPPPVASDDAGAEIIPLNARGLASASALSKLLGVVGKTFEPNLGHWSGVAFDCRGEPTAGTSIEVEAPGARPVRFYSDALGLPTIDATETSSSGDLGYVNLDVGDGGSRVVTARASRGAPPREIGSYSVVLRAGHMTRMDVPPLPR